MYQTHHVTQDTLFVKEGLSWQDLFVVVCCGGIGSPSNPGLLGLNIDGGKEVRIRLRYNGRERDFYPYESILGTLLHELTHNEHGPHDAKFYKLLDEITKVTQSPPFVV